MFAGADCPFWVLGGAYTVVGAKHHCEEDWTWGGKWGSAWDASLEVDTRDCWLRATLTDRGTPTST